MGSKTIYERFVWFDSCVRSGRYPSATTLARRFEMSPKTAQRDIEFMRDRLKCPLEYDRTRKGYFYTSGSFSLPLTYLSTDELSSILLARKLLQHISGDSIRNELSSIISKITSILEKHIDNSNVIDSSLSFKLIEYSPVSDHLFKDVLGSCIRRSSISFEYYSPSKEERTVRNVDPYHLLNYMGTWHLIGYCHLREDFRDFVLTRVSNLAVLDRTFRLRKDIDINELLQSGFGIFKGKEKQQVRLRFSPQKAKWIESQIWHKDQRTKYLADGSLELSFPAASLIEVKMEVLKHGADVEVISPSALRKQIKAEAERILALY